jgi:hypothetical protein
MDMPHAAQQLLRTWGSIKLCCHVCDVSLIDGDPDAQLLHLSTAVQVLQLLYEADVHNNTCPVGVYSMQMNSCSMDRTAFKFLDIA